MSDPRLLIATRAGTVERPAFFCLVPKCGAVFYRWQAAEYQKHMARCCAENEAELRRLSISEQLPGMFGEGVSDDELERWVRQHRVEIVEGRRRM